VLYYRLAKREEKDMEEEFAQKYEEYKEKTKMFIPYVV
jgi:protein-S-isoprenylcysteine O-methyltransferase Ste14